MSMKNLMNKKFIISMITVFAVYLFLFNIFIVKWFMKDGSEKVSSVILPYVIVHIDLKVRPKRFDSTFIIHTMKEWNSLPASLFPQRYNLGVFKSRVNRYLLGGPPKLNYLESLLPLLKDHGANGLLMEYEDMFPYEGKLVNLSARNHYDPLELKNFLVNASNWGFEIIPLIQTFGHMEHVLKLKEFKNLREDPFYPDSLCPSQEQSKKLIRNMIEQVIKFHNSVSPLKHIHIGCDEVFQINKCQYCVSRKNSDRDIFIDHVSHIALYVKDISPNTTVLIWDDMLRSIKPYEWTDIKNINNVEPVVWSYQKTPVIPHVSLFQYHKKFKNTWAATAFKGADGKTATFPNLKYRVLNHFAWMNYLLDYTYPGEGKLSNFQGIILTGWSRYAHMEPSCELLPVSLPSLVVNLLIIKRFKEDVVRNGINDLSAFISKYLNDNINRSLKCYEGFEIINNDSNLPCNFEGIKLYSVLKQLLILINEVVSNLNNNMISLASVEYYSTLKYINLNTLKNELGLHSASLDKLTRLENMLVKEMKRYYDDEFVYEYVTEKTYNVKKHLKLVLKVLNSDRQVQDWERGPRLVNFTIT